MDLKRILRKMCPERKEFQEMQKTRSIFPQEKKTMFQKYSLLGIGKLSPDFGADLAADEPELPPQRRAVNS